MKHLLLIFLLATLSTISFAQNVSQKEEQKKEIEKEIAAIDRQISATTAQKKESVNTLVLTQKKIEARKTLIQEIEQEVKTYDQKIKIKNRELNRLQAKLDTLRRYHERLVLSAYKHRDNKVLLMYILASEDINQGLRRWRYLKNISESIQEQATQIRLTEAALQTEREELGKLKQKSLTVKNERTQEYNNLTSEEKKVNKMIKNLSAQEKQMKKKLKEKKKEVEKLNKEIEKILAEAVKQAEKEKKGQKGTATEKINYQLSGKFAENKGKLPWPVNNGVIIQKFGQSYHPVFKNIQMPFNNGINISSAKGSEATSIFDGTVKQILIMPGYNQCVLVQHGEFFTFYCKLERVYVKNGDKISAGEKIGSIQTNETGNAELHFQVWKGTTKQNPESWLRKK